jgi:prepilin-type N-terminal cleavage/methylation domain-containing protein
VSAGFTLPEALIALTIAAVLMIMVGTVFLVQNDFYSHVNVRSQVQENTRAAVEIVASEIRSVTAKGVFLADSTQFGVRSPIVTGLVCGVQGGDVVVHVQGGVPTDSADVVGFGYRNPTTGVWSFYERAWTTMHTSGGTPALQCYTGGADTTGASANFLRMSNIDNDTGVNRATLAAQGAVLMFFRKTHFRFNSSTLISGDRSLWQGPYGGTLSELVTGMASAAHFEFRTGASTWAKSITGAKLDSINAIRIQSEAIGKGTSSRESSYDFGFTVDIPLANAY